MHVQLELRLDMSYDMQRMLLPIKDLRSNLTSSIALDCELRRMLKEIMENPKK